jgi:hypothetical protein
VRSYRNAATLTVLWLAALACLSSCRNTNSTLASNGVPVISGTSQTATVSGGPSSYTVDFGQVAVGDQLQTELSLTDNGNSPLQVLSVDAPNDPQFTVSLAPATGIQAGSSVRIPCSFKPFGAGPKSATMRIHTDSQAIPVVTLTLQGVGVLVKLQVEPQTLDFGTVVIHSSVTLSVTLTNRSALNLTVTESAIEGSGAALFAYVPITAAASTLSLQAGGSQSITFSYQPAIPSTLDAAYITLTPSIGPQILVTLRAVAVETGLSIIPSPMDFNFVQPGQVSTQTLRIKNIGNQGIDVTQVSITNPGGGAFAIPSGSLTNATPLLAGHELDVPVQFVPTGEALYAGEISVVSNDNLAQVAVPLQGFGGGAAISCTPPALDFGLVAAGIGSTQSVLCTNTGTNVTNHPEAGLLISKLPITSAAFNAAIASGTPPGYLRAGETALLNVAYVPSAATSDTATLTIESNVTNAPIINLSGQGIVVGKCSYTIEPTLLDWGEVPGADKTLRYTQAFTIQNLGPNPCVVAGLHLSEANGVAFALPDGPIISQLLAVPGQPQIVDGGALPTGIAVPVSFAASQGLGSYAGQAAFTISDPTAPNQTVALAAVAGASCFFLRPDPLNLGTAGLTSSGQYCQNNHQQFVAVNNCAQPVTITNVSLGAGAPFDALSTPSLPFSVAPGVSSPPFVMGFKPTAPGDYYSPVKVQTDLLAVPFGLTVHGKALAGTQQSDTFQGQSSAAVDVLWVVDNDDLGAELTCCGAPPGLLDKLPDFVDAVQAGVDYQMGVVSDECPDHDNGNIEPCPTCANIGTSPTIITPGTPNPGGALKDLIQQIANVGGTGTCQANYNATMTAGWTALQPGILSGHNAGFLRDGAALAVIVYDLDGYAEDEGSSQSTDFYLNFFSSLKGGDPQLVNVSMMYAGVYGAYTTGPRYTSLTQKSGGQLIDTAGPNWTKQINLLWNSVSGGSGGFVLSGTPVPETIQVWLDGPPPGPGVTVHGLQIQQANPNGTWNWKYLPTSNSIVFNGQNISLGSTDTLTAVYTLACD